jgi:hypothetical protein
MMMMMSRRVSSQVCLPVRSLRSVPFSRWGSTHQALPQLTYFFEASE